MKGKALEHIRRRLAAAPDGAERALWMVARRLIETESALDQAGQVVDESGVTWCYVVALKGILTEAGRDLSTMISVHRAAGDPARFIRYAKGVNERLKISEEQKQLALDRLCQAVLRTG